MISHRAIGCAEPDTNPTSEPGWESPPPSLTLSYDWVDVWRVPLKLSESERDQVEAGLSLEERRRASRFRHSVDRSRFVAAHSALRAILGRYLGLEPSRLRFSYGRFGKPSIVEPLGASSVEFNLSHSGGLALIAVSWGRRVGIDLEHVDASRSGQEVAETYFSPREIAALRALPRERQTDAFFACWTRKEAYLKARGDGLSFPLDRFSVSVSPEEPAPLLDCGDDETQRWVLQNLRPGAGWAAALVVEGRDWRLRRWRWEEPQWNSFRTTRLPPSSEFSSRFRVRPADWRRT
jgi:4'-phosphopantetheinyl transferase